MKHISLLVLTSVLLFPAAASAQGRTDFFSVGMTAGYSGNSTSMTAQYIDHYNIHRSRGLAAGLFLQYTAKEWLALRLEPMFIQKGYRTDRRGYIATMNLESYQDLSYMYHNVKDSYLQLPVMVRLQTPVLNLPVRIYCECGYYAGWWALSRYEGVIYNSSIDFVMGGKAPEEYARYHYDGKKPFVSERDNRLELGYILGIGAEWDLSDRFFIGAAWREYHAVTSYTRIHDSTSQPYYNTTRTMNLSAGINF